MKLHNKSARPHWLGDVLIAPLATEKVSDEWRGVYNMIDLEEVKESAEVVEEAKKPGRKAKVQAVAEGTEEE